MNHINQIKRIFFLFIIVTLTACGATATKAPTIEPSDIPPGETPTTAPPNTPQPTSTPAGPVTITLMSHDSFNASEDVIEAFETAHNVRIEFLRAGDTGSALNQAILSKENPLADVFFGVDNTFFSRAIENNIFEPYNSPLLADIPDDLKLDPENRLLPVDFGDVCLNYDKAWFEEKGLAPPTNLEDLLKEEYKGLTVVENPATSSPGLAFLLATVTHFGQPGYLDFWRQMVAQDVAVTAGWEEAYYGQFSRYDGDRPLVVSYASSPAAEVFFAEQPLAEAPTGSVVGDESCFRQIEFVGILAGTEKREQAEKLVDFLLSREFQEDIPLNMFVFPANQQAELPEVFVKYTDLPTRPATLSPEEIAGNREEWLNAWTATVLR
ncbi:MAG: thiamine ABC transporter substrate-binding protein [Anaerolineae bacterium]|nr:thiamine ABC transporter substrate-binding protein [Anaerolineae bacterium]